MDIIDGFDEERDERRIAELCAHTARELYYENPAKWFDDYGAMLEELDDVFVVDGNGAQSWYPTKLQDAITVISKYVPVPEDEMTDAEWQEIRHG